MKKILMAGAAVCISILAVAQKKDIVKTGYNLGPMPVVAFDADKGFQYGALVNIYNYGDGELYPNYKSLLYLEASFFSKGSQLYQLTYDNKVLIPGIRWSSNIFATIDKAMDFYGFNGYESFYDADRVQLGKENKANKNPEGFIYTPYYRFSRVQLMAKTDFVGDITDHLKWEAGYHFSYYKTGAINRASINKGKADYNIFPDTVTTLFEEYVVGGLIGDDEKDGGVSSAIRAGLTYDTRDKEGAPSKGIWAEGHVTAAPGFLGTTMPYARWSLTLRQYFPIVKNDVLTFAYRLNYEGTMGKNAPFYILPFITVMGNNGDKDGFGGYRTVRGILRDRVVGLDMASYNAEMRWRFVRFPWLNQNISFGLSVFSDGAMVTRGRDMSPQPGTPALASGRKEVPHITFGGGLRFIMNENFIVAFEYGKPIDRQDGPGAFYINTGYLF